MSRRDRILFRRIYLTIPATRRRVAVALVLALMSVSTGAARAADGDPLPDARMEGYGESLAVEGGAMGSLMLFALTGVIAIGTMFKSSNRTHLD